MIFALFIINLMIVYIKHKYYDRIDLGLFFYYKKTLLQPVDQL